MAPFEQLCGLGALGIVVLIMVLIGPLVKDDGYWLVVDRGLDALDCNFSIFDSGSLLQKCMIFHP